MKLRMKGSSLRLRLTQGEVNRLGAGEDVAEEVRFGPRETLTYRLGTDRVISVITASYTDNIISIRIPETAAVRWARTDEVTLSHSQALDDGELKIVIEKDFACLAPRSGEDESDNFPHPAAAEGRKTC